MTDKTKQAAAFAAATALAGIAGTITAVKVKRLTSHIYDLEDEIAMLHADLANLNDSAGRHLTFCPNVNKKDSKFNPDKMLSVKIRRPMNASRHCGQTIDLITAEIPTDDEKATGRAWDAVLKHMRYLRNNYSTNTPEAFFIDCWFANPEIHPNRWTATIDSCPMGFEDRLVRAAGFHFTDDGAAWSPFTVNPETVTQSGCAHDECPPDAVKADFVFNNSVKEMYISTTSDGAADNAWHNIRNTLETKLRDNSRYPVVHATFQFGDKTWGKDIEIETADLTASANRIMKVAGFEHRVFENQEYWRFTGPKE